MDSATLPQWLGLIVTSAAVFLALMVYRKSVRDSARDQPRKVWAAEIRQHRCKVGKYIHVGDAHVTVTGDLAEKATDPHNGPVYIAREECFALTVRVTNGSDEVISFVSVRVGLSPDLLDPGKASPMIRHIEPGGKRDFVLVLPPTRNDLVGDALILPAVTFRDGLGRGWEWMLSAPLRRMSGIARLETAWQRFYQSVPFIFGRPRIAKGD